MELEMKKLALPITGRAPGPFRAGPGGNCVCPACGTKVPKVDGIPCTDVDCPNCGTAMVRDFGLSDLPVEMSKVAIPITGRAPGPFRAGPGGNCVCPACGTKVPKVAGIPCTDVDCPKCGTKMVRDFGKSSTPISTQTPGEYLVRLMKESAEKRDEKTKKLDIKKMLVKQKARRDPENKEGPGHKKTAEEKKAAFKVGFRRGLKDLGITDEVFVSLVKTAATPRTPLAEAGLLGLKGLGGTLGTTYEWALKEIGDIWPLVVFGGPALAGMLGGMTHSKLGSPSPLDLEAVRQAEKLRVLKGLTEEARYRKRLLSD